MINESRDSVGEIPSPKITKGIVRARELNTKNIYGFHIGASLRYKLGRGSFVLLQISADIVKKWGNFIITN